MNLATLIDAAAFVESQEEYNSFADSLFSQISNQETFPEAIEKFQQKRKRSCHKEEEKKRRAELKSYFIMMESVLPAYNDGVANSSISLLHRALWYIKALEEINLKFEKDLEKLTNEKIQRIKRLLDLKKELIVLREHDYRAVKTVENQMATVMNPNRNINFKFEEDLANPARVMEDFENCHAGALDKSEKIDQNNRSKLVSAMKNHVGDSEMEEGQIDFSPALQEPLSPNGEGTAPLVIDSHLDIPLKNDHRKGPLGSHPVKDRDVRITAESLSYKVFPNFVASRPPKANLKCLGNLILLPAEVPNFIEIRTPRPAVQKNAPIRTILDLSTSHALKASPQDSTKSMDNPQQGELEDNTPLNLSKNEVICTSCNRHNQNVAPPGGGMVSTMVAVQLAPSFAPPLKPLFHGTLLTPVPESALPATLLTAVPITSLPIGRLSAQSYLMRPTVLMLQRK